MAIGEVVVGSLTNLKAQWHAITINNTLYLNKISKDTTSLSIAAQELLLIVLKLL
jgi:hypothetical protein